MWVYFFVRGWSVPDYTVGGSGIMPVAVMLVVASAVMILVSLLTRPPDAETVEAFFPRSR